MNKQFVSMAAAAGLVLGGLGFAGAASALGGDSDAPESSDAAVAFALQDTDAGTPGIVTLQDTETDEPDAGEAETEGERDGRRGCGDLDTAAETIGVTEDELHAAIESGDSVAG